MKSWWIMIGLCTFTYLVGFLAGATNSGGWWLIIDPGIFVVVFVGGAGILFRNYRRKLVRQWEHGIDAAKWTPGQEDE